MVTTRCYLWHYTAMCVYSVAMVRYVCMPLRHIPNKVLSINPNESEVRVCISKDYESYS